MTKSYRKRHSIEEILGEVNKPFIVMNDNAMVFTGLKRGEAQLVISLRKQNRFLEILSLKLYNELAIVKSIKNISDEQD